MSAFEALWGRRDLRILIVGHDGRASAFERACWRSSRVRSVFVTPGNGGTTDKWRASVDDHDLILELIRREHIDLVLISPEGPLADGLADRIAAAGVAVVGPGAFGARIEADKSVAAELCLRRGVRRPRWKAVRTFSDAVDEILDWGPVPVVKARGLCSGKGVFVEDTVEAAIEAVRRILVDRVFHEQGDVVLLEDRLYGDEFSLIAACNRRDYVLFPVARDHKRAYAGDVGPNTGGMGAFSPVPGYDDAFLAQMGKEFIEPVLQGMIDANHPYRGFLYAGLMKTDSGIYLIEYNCRFGDPEAECVLPRLETDFVEVLLCMTEGGDMRRISPLRISPMASTTVVVASGGYPGTLDVGHPITGVEAAKATGAYVDIAGADRRFDSRLVNTGGRVAMVTALGETVEEAALRAHAAAELISFRGAWRREDIGLNTGG
ncbi:phosphoribosylamine--glycine ligase [Candidatus Kaiserbacteria bacterium]|nr:phosphoribosylamine--glycine ligase [Candidatus Kaiserbacteria bacterium]